MERAVRPKMQKPKRRRNTEAQKQRELEATTSNSKDFGSQAKSFVQEDELTKLRRENALLRKQLDDAQFAQQQSECKVVAAEKSKRALMAQLQKADSDLVNSENKVASLNLKMDMAKQKLKKQSADAAANARVVCVANQSTTASQTEERDISDLIQQLLKAHEDLEACTAKLQQSADCTDDTEQEHHEKVRALKRGIMNLSVKLQEEQVTLMKKVIKLVPCNAEDECSSQTTQSARAEELANVNLQIQKLHMELLQQALSLKTAGQKKGPTKYKWNRTHRDQEQQTDQLDETAESQDGAVSEQQLQLDKGQQVQEDEAAKNQEDKDVPALEMQQLKEKLREEKALRVTNETQVLKLKDELSKKNSAVEEAQSKVGQLKKDLLKMKAEAQEELEHLRKVKDEALAVQKKTEEQLQIQRKQWQEEKVGLQRAIEGLQQTLREKRRESSKSNMASRMDNQDHRRAEMPKPKDENEENGWLGWFFSCSAFR